MDNEELLRQQLQAAVALMTAMKESLENDGEIGSPELFAKVLAAFLDQADTILDVSGKKD